MTQGTLAKWKPLKSASEPGTFIPPPSFKSDQELMHALAECDSTRDGAETFSFLLFGAYVVEGGDVCSYHPGQLDFIERAKAQVNLLSPGNAWGKTMLISREAVRMCWLKEGLSYSDPREWIQADYRGLIASYEYGIAAESFQRLMQYHRAGGNFSRLVANKWEAEGSQKILFKNGAILDFGSLKDNGRHVEATRRNFIFVDEVGQIPDFETCYNDVLYARTMAVGGVIWLIGTPKPQTDAFVYHIFNAGIDGTDPMYFAMEGNTLRDNCFITAKEKKRIRGNPKLFLADGTLTTLGKQVVEGKFLLAGGLFFNRLRLAGMFSGQYPLHQPGEEVKREGKVFLVAWDIGGRKKKSDQTVCHVWDVTTMPFKCVEIIALDGLDADWQEKYNEIERTYKTYRPPFVLIDVTGSTKDSIAEELENRGIPIEPVHFGGSATGGKKYNMLRSLQMAMEMECQVPIPQEDGTVLMKPHRGMVLYPSSDNEPLAGKVKKQFEYYILQDEKLKQDHVMCAAMLAYEAMQSLVPDFDPSWSI